MRKKPLLVALTALLSLFALATLAQAPSARVSGKVLDKSGQPLGAALVVYTNLDSGHGFKFKTDKNGEFAGVGIPYGDYMVEILTLDGNSLFQQKQSVSSELASQRLAVDLSKPQAAAQPKLTPEQIEAIKAQRAKALAENALITQANAALQSKDWAQAEPLLKQLIEFDPARWEYSQGLGTAQLNLGRYEDAVKSYENGIQLARKVIDPKEDPARLKLAIAQMLTNQGNAYLKLRKNDEAIAAYSKAAALDPNPGTAYFNLCATQYNMGNMDSAAVACTKAISVDPNKADAYFIKGSALYGNGNVEKDGKYTVPPGTLEALNKYLELAPNGGHAADVKAMLEALGIKVQTTYEKKKK